jgi:hypothetical protein
MITRPQDGPIKAQTQTGRPKPPRRRQKPEAWPSAVLALLVLIAVLLPALLALLIRLLALLAAFLAVLLLGLLLRATPALLLLIGHSQSSLSRGDEAPRLTNHRPCKDVPVFWGLLPVRLIVLIGSGGGTVRVALAFQVLGADAQALLAATGGFQVGRIVGFRLIVFGVDVEFGHGWLLATGKTGSDTPMYHRDAPHASSERLNPLIGHHDSLARKTHR